MTVPFIRTVSAFIYHDGEVLLHKHKRLGRWMGPGGKVDEGEDELETLLREVFEETGIRLDPAQFEVYIDENRTSVKAPDCVVRHNFDDYKAIDHTYYIEVGSNIRNQKLVTEVEGLEIGWFSFSEALGLNMFRDTFCQLIELTAQEGFLV